MPQALAGTAAGEEPALTVAASASAGPGPHAWVTTLIAVLAAVVSDNMPQAGRPAAVGAAEQPRIAGRGGAAPHERQPGGRRVCGLVAVVLHVAAVRSRRWRGGGHERGVRQVIRAGGGRDVVADHAALTGVGHPANVARTGHPAYRD